MKIIFSEIAKEELEDAVHYYEGEYSGLGLRFKEEVKDALQRIAQYPRAWSIEKNEIRRYLLHKFPNKLLYSIETDHIFIIAVAHQHRQPDYWMDRWR
jgi:plasmid stabilization system protein ParE